MANIEHLLDDIRKNKYCVDMKETFCNALNEANANAEEIESNVKKIKDEIISINANAEIIDARCGEENLGDFNRKISSQLDTKANKTKFIYVDDYVKKGEDIGEIFNNLLLQNDNSTFIFTEKSYTYATPISINKRCNFICLGDLNYIGTTESALIIDCRNSLIQLGNVNSEADGIYIATTSGNLNIFNKIYGSELTAKKCGVYIATSNHGIQELVLDFSKIRGETQALSFYCYSFWIGEIYIYNAKLEGGTAIKTVSNGTNITGIRALNITLEGLSNGGLHLNGCLYSDFKMRRQESIIGKELVLTGINESIKIESDMISLSNIDISKNKGENITLRGRVMNTPSNYIYLSNEVKIKDNLFIYEPFEDKNINFQDGNHSDVSSQIFRIDETNNYMIPTNIVTKNYLGVILGDEYKYLSKGVCVFITTKVTVKDMDGEIILDNTNTTYDNSVVRIKYLGDKLSNKKWSIEKLDGSIFKGYTSKFLFVGDDYTRGHYDTISYGFAGIIKESNPYMTNNIIGRNGYTLSKTSSNSILSLVETEIETSNDYNHVFFTGGYQDFLNGIAVGTYDATTQTGFDENTIYGAFESMINKSKTKWSNAKLYYIIPHNLFNSELNALYDNLKLICNKWNVTVIDIRKTTMDIRELSIKCVCTGETSEGTEGDGVYPNRNGYIKYYIDYINKIIKGRVTW